MRARGAVQLEAVSPEVLHRIDVASQRAEFVDPESTGACDLEMILATGANPVSEEFHDRFMRARRHDIIPGKFIDEARSAHGVGFGRIVGSRPEKQSGEGHVLSVATKPFGEVTSATNEVTGYWALQAIGVETFRPVGIFNTTPGAFVVATEKRNDLVSLDRDDWIVGRRVTSEEELEVAERNNRTIREIAQTLAWLHLHGIFHKDGQIKNFAVTQTGTVGVIDTENLAMLAVGDPSTDGHIGQDVDKLVKSLVNNEKQQKIFGVGMLAGLSMGEARNSYEELFLEPYSQCLVDCIDLGCDEAQIELLLDGIQRHFDRSVADAWPLCLQCDD